jgi:tRNA threonylcarbamoyladenosine biosynthesis protein TsaB
MQTKEYILWIETSTDIGAVGLYEGEKLLGKIEYAKAKTHSKLLTLMVKNLLQDMEVAGNELAAIAVSKGPGSYTGLRVGVSTAKGLCFALDKPLMALGSLEAIAWQAQPIAKALNAYICPLIDARRMEVFCSIFDADIKTMSETHARIIHAESFSEIWQEKKLIFVGDGAPKCQALFEGNENVLFFPEISSSAAGIGKVLLEKFRAGDFEDLAAFEPFYLKDYVANGNFQKAVV